MPPSVPPEPKAIYPELHYPIALFCISRSPPVWLSQRSLRFSDGCRPGLVRPPYYPRLQGTL